MFLRDSIHVKFAMQMYRHDISLIGSFEFSTEMYGIKGMQSPIFKITLLHHQYRLN